MANEITINLSLAFSKLGVTPNSGPGVASTVGNSWTNLQFNMNGTTYQGGVVTNVATTATALVLGNVATAHYALFQNLDSTNYVTIFNGSGNAATAAIQLLAGDIALIPLVPGITPYALANTAAVELWYMIIGA